MSKYIKKFSLKNTIIWSSICAVLLAFIIVLPIIAQSFDSILRQYLGEEQASLVVSEGSIGLDTKYNKSSFSSVKELEKFEEKLCIQTAEEGVALLQNKDNMLPLQKGSSVSLFSIGSVEPIYGGAGSGGSSSDKSITIKKAFENVGISVNETLWSFYQGKASNHDAYGRDHNTYYDGAENWKINEVPLNEINVLSSANGTTPVFVLTRTGGEGRDLARGMYSFASEYQDRDKHYLEPDSRELAILSYLNQNFSQVLLIINTNNAFELGWVEEFQNIKSVLFVPGSGTMGFQGMANLIVNDANFSGHIVDTFAYDAFNSPAMQNMGDIELYLNGNGTNKFMVNYKEGIYVGYKYYETRYEDVVLEKPAVGEYDYASTVQYPFGYGMSYTQFEWSNYQYQEADGIIILSVEVKNIGETAGKDVVQVYYNSPYTAYDIENGIEKSAVSLCEFKKTAVLEPQDSEVVEISFPASEMKAFDSKKAKTYIMDEGDYYITIGKDAHQAVNNILMQKKADGINVNESKMVGTGDATLVGKYTVETLDTVTYSVDDTTQNEVKNLFDYANFPDTVYLTRNNWEGTYPTRPVSSGKGSSYSEKGGQTLRVDTTQDMMNRIYSKDSGNPVSDGSLSGSMTFGKKNGIELIDLRGASYEDKRWDSLLEQMTAREMGLIIGQSGFRTPIADSIMKPVAQDNDGPAGLNNIVSKEIIGYAFPVEALMAMTWNDEILLEMGRCIGEDGLYYNIQGWYAPAVNIHRTPFAGRNFEYFSEDAYISGRLARNEIEGAAEKGMYAFIKHLALNDQESHRIEIATYSNEQAIREIYIKPFEMCIKSKPTTINYFELQNDGSFEAKTVEIPTCRAFMSSMNRIGPTWTGGNYSLQTALFKNEFGFRGFFITDYTGSTDYMDPTQSVKSGGNAILSTVCPIYGGVDDNYANYYYSKEAIKGVLYCVVNSSLMNGMVHGTAYIQGYAYYQTYIILVELLFTGVLLFGLFSICKNLINKQRLKSKILSGDPYYQRKLIDFKRVKVTCGKFDSEYEKFTEKYSEQIKKLLILYDAKGKTKEQIEEEITLCYLDNQVDFEKVLVSYNSLSFAEKWKLGDSGDAMSMLYYIVRKIVPTYFTAENIYNCNEAV